MEDGEDALAADILGRADDGPLRGLRLAAQVAFPCLGLAQARRHRRHLRHHLGFAAPQLQIGDGADQCGKAGQDCDEVRGYANTP